MTWERSGRLVGRPAGHTFHECILIMVIISRIHTKYRQVRRPGRGRRATAGCFLDVRWCVVRYKSRKPYIEGPFMPFGGVWKGFMRIRNFRLFDDFVSWPGLAIRKPLAGTAPGVARVEQGPMELPARPVWGQKSRKTCIWARFP